MSDRLSASRSQHIAAMGKKAGGQSGGQKCSRKPDTFSPKSIALGR